MGLGALSLAQDTSMKFYGKTLKLKQLRERCPKDGLLVTKVDVTEASSCCVFLTQEPWEFLVRAFLGYWGAGCGFPYAVLNARNLFVYFHSFPMDTGRCVS